MSDNADRSGFNGGTGSVPHNDFGSPGTASTSTPSEDYSDFFDWDAYFDRVETDVTTAPSVGKLTNGSSILTHATTPVASHAEDSPMQDALDQEYEPPNVWPKVSDPPPSRDTNISLEASLSPQASGEMQLEKQTQVPSASSQKGTRIIKDLDKTNKVRELRACYHCKMNRKACNSGRVCEECSKRYKKPSSAEHACIRIPLKDLVPPKIGRWNWVDLSRIMPTRDRFMSVEADRLLVSCSESVNSPRLELRVGRFALADMRDHGVHGVHRFGIMPSSLPLDDAMYHWMEQHILVNNNSGFEAELDRLLLGLVSQPRANMQQWPHQLPEQLLLNLFKMRCLCKIWSSKQLFFWRADGQLLPLDMRFATIQDSLRLLAGRIISELERKVIEDLGKFLDRKETKEMRPTTALLKWVVLWQMILIYRQSLSWVMEQQEPIPYEAMPEVAWRHTFRDETIQLLDAIIVIYSVVFRKNTTVKMVINAEPLLSECDNSGLYAAQTRVWQTVLDFYQQVSSQVIPTDDLFKECIVEREQEFLRQSTNRI